MKIVTLGHLVQGKLVSCLHLSTTVARDPSLLVEVRDVSSNYGGLMIGWDLTKCIPHGVAPT